MQFCAMNGGTHQTGDWSTHGTAKEFFTGSHKKERLGIGKRLNKEASR
jgi:hypothetical protein